MMIQKPQEQPTTGPNTVLPSFALKPPNPHSSAALDLVECTIYENSTLQKQIKHIETSLAKTRSLSNGLLKQNEGLRSLYKERTRDIGKLIKSISIESEEDRTNYQHQCHLLQELNFATLKEIKVIDQQIKDSSSRAAQHKDSIDRIAHLKNQLEHDNLNKLRARLNNGLSNESIAKLRRKYEEEVSEQNSLERQVNELTTVTTRLGGQIDRLRESEEPARSVIVKDKSEYELRLATISDQNKRLLEEYNSDRVDYDKSQEEYHLKEEKFQKGTTLLLEHVQQYQNSNQTFNELNGNRDSIRNRVAFSLRQQETKQNQLSELRNIKADLINQIQVQKKRKAARSDELSHKAEELRQGNKNSISKLSKVISNNDVNFEVETTRLAKEKEKAEAFIVSREYEVSSLEEQIQNYSILVKELPNPICEIERIELMRRLKKGK